MFSNKEVLEQMTKLEDENTKLKEKVLDLKSELKEMKSDYEIKTRELLSLKDLEYKQELHAIKMESANELIEEKQKLNTNFYEKMTSELTKLHSEGNSQTKFVQDLALQMVNGKNQLAAPSEK